MEIVGVNLINKYTPINIKDIVGSKQQINSIIYWLNDFNKKKRIKNKSKNKNQDNFSTLLISGDNGTGKTTIVNAILNDMQYTIKTINFRTLHINSPYIIEHIISCGDIYNRMQNINNKKIAIVVDEIEFLGSSVEKTIINNILKINAEKWTCPIIFIGNNTHKKIISLIKKESLHIELNKPSINNISQLLERICIGENIVFENDIRIVNKIIEQCRQDYRQLIVILNQLHRLYNNSVITYNRLIKYLTYLDNKDTDMSIYQNTLKLFTEFKSISSSLKIFENDKTNMPLMVHQNYITVVNNYNYNNNNNIDISNNISTSIAHGDIIDNYIYSEQNWNLQDIYGYYSCIYPSYTINNNLDTKTLLRDTEYPKYMPKYNSVYPKDYNKTSTKCINYKNIKYANKFFVNINIYDYIYICKYIKYMLSQNKLDLCKYILKKYNINVAGIMYILKIDKINGTKKDITKDLEKKIKEISNEPIKQSFIKKMRTII